MLHGKCQETIKKLGEEIARLSEDREKIKKELIDSKKAAVELQEKLAEVERKLTEMTKLAKGWKDECNRLKNSVPQDYAIFVRESLGGKSGDIDVMHGGQLVRIVSRISGVATKELKFGWELLLNSNGNTAIYTTKEFWRWGNQVSFVVKLTDDLALVSGHGGGENMQCLLSPELKDKKLKKGDLFLNCGGLLVKALPKTEEADHDFISVKGLDFSKVGGLSKQIREIQEALLPFSEREVYMNVLKGVEMPRGIILDGPPGCGKTLIARVIASYLARQKNKEGYFIALTSTEMLDKYHGETERKLRELFSRAKEKAEESGLVVIFIDEIDSLVPNREMTREKQPWMAQAVTQMCGLLDGIEPLSDVLVIGATNSKEIIDPSILRPGRLTVHIRVPRPDKDGAREILKIHLDPELPFAQKYYREDLREFTDHFGTGQRELAELNKDPILIRDHFIETILSRVFYDGPAKSVNLKAGQEEETELTIDNKIEYLENGKLKMNYLKDHISGDMLRNLVDKARRLALSRFISAKRDNLEAKMEIFKRDFFEAVDKEYMRITTSLSTVKTDSKDGRDNDKKKIGFNND